MWDPYPYCGYPIHGDLQAQIFYPPAWLAFAARMISRPDSMLYWLEWLVVLHMMLAGLLTYWLLRRQNCGIASALLGGTIFQLGAYFASQAQHLGAICGAAWMPLAWLSAIELGKKGCNPRRWGALLALSFALSFLAGFTAVTLVVGLSAVMVLLGSRPRPIALLWFVLAAAAVVPLAAVQLFPTLDTVAWSLAGARAQWNQGMGTPLDAWKSLVWPDYFHVFTPFDDKLFRNEYNFTFLYCYSGAVAAIGSMLALLGKHRIFPLLAIAFAVLQAGPRIAWWPPVFEKLPAMIRGSMYADFFLAAACLAIAVGTALAAARSRPWFAWTLALGTGVELIIVSSNRPMNSEEPSYTRITTSRAIDGSAASLRKLHELLDVSTAASAPRLADPRGSVHYPGHASSPAHSGWRQRLRALARRRASHALR